MTPRKPQDQKRGVRSLGLALANLFNQSSHLIVEGLRRGLHPKDAGMEALKRIRDNTVEKRLLTPDGRPDFYVSFYILDRQGRHAGVDLYTSYSGQKRRYAVCTENGPQILDSEGLLGEGPPAPGK